MQDSWCRRGSCLTPPPVQVCHQGGEFLRLALRRCIVADDGTTQRANSGGHTMPAATPQCAAGPDVAGSKAAGADALGSTAARLLGFLSLRLCLLKPVLQSICACNQVQGACTSDARADCPEGVGAQADKCMDAGVDRTESAVADGTDASTAGAGQHAEAGQLFSRCAATPEAACLVHLLAHHVNSTTAPLFEPQASHPSLDPEPEHPENAAASEAAREEQAIAIDGVLGTLAAVFGGACACAHSGYSALARGDEADRERDGESAAPADLAGGYECEPAVGRRACTSLVEASLEERFWQPLHDVLRRACSRRRPGCRGALRMVH